jgi:hypothetical protein
VASFTFRQPYPREDVTAVSALAIFTETILSHPSNTLNILSQRHLRNVAEKFIEAAGF